jgi:glycosyltransferase involved in cell wall biosynthesis
VLTDPRLAAGLGAAGVRRAAEFTWERCAAATMRAYEDVLRSRAANTGAP